MTGTCFPPAFPSAGHPGIPGIGSLASFCSLRPWTLGLGCWPSLVRPVPWPHPAAPPVPSAGFSEAPARLRGLLLWLWALRGPCFHLRSAIDLLCGLGYVIALSVLILPTGEVEVLDWRSSTLPCDLSFCTFEQQVLALLCASASPTLQRKCWSVLSQAGVSEPWFPQLGVGALPSFLEGDFEGQTGKEECRCPQMGAQGWWGPMASSPRWA